MNRAMTPAANPEAQPPSGAPAQPHGSSRLSVAVERDAEGKPRAFALTLANQTVTLRPGMPWIRTDEYKWVTRGLIEAPQSFQVEPDGTVDINGEKLRLDDPDGAVKLEHELNKHHVAAPRKAPVTRAAAAAPARSGPATPHFQVKLDHFGHLSVVCTRGAERVETGLRGLSTLVQNRLMLPPKQYHVDPLHRGIDLDGTFFEATETGAAQLAEALNTRYAPSPEDDQDTAIEIRDNPAAATGFDIHFVTVVSGARFEVKGHLSQDKLDQLQDSAKCDLLQPEVILRLTPPNLLFRRRRPDGGEAHIPELPDVQYRRVTAPELQRLFNHPLIRRGGTSVAAAALHPDEHAADPVELRVSRNPQNKGGLWFEILTTAGGPTEGRALTHHNVAGLQEAGFFLPHLDVNLSLDHQTLSVLNKDTGHNDSLTLDVHSADSVLAEASHLLTAALKPPTRPAPAPTPPSVPTPPPPAIAPPSPTASHAPPPPLPTVTPQPPLPQAPPLSTAPPAPTPALPPPPPAKSAVPSPPPSPTSAGRAVSPAPSAAADATSTLPVQSTTASPAPDPDPGVDPEVVAWFKETSPLAVNLAVFDQLAACLGIPIQDVLLSLPRAFENRRFQVLSFSHPEIQSILDLRSEGFYGFYLTHVNEQTVLLVYACKGRHIEWGPDRCLLQSAVSAEPNEFKHQALLGLAQDPEGHFAFIVTPEYAEWAKAFAPAYRDVCARFVTPGEVALAADQFTMIWPARDSC